MSQASIEFLCDLLVVTWKATTYIKDNFSGYLYARAGQTKPMNELCLFFTAIHRQRSIWLTPSGLDDDGPTTYQVPINKMAPCIDCQSVKRLYEDKKNDQEGGPSFMKWLSIKLVIEWTNRWQNSWERSQLVAYCANWTCNNCPAILLIAFALREECYRHLWKQALSG